MTAHKWKFFRAGGFDQVRLDEGKDIASLAELDPKLWVAIACPTKGLELDEHTLAILDTDKDGRVRVPEVIAATSWACEMLKDADELRAGKTELPLASIDAESAEGKTLLASAKQILKNLGKADSKTISPADTKDTAAIFGKTLFNGDGIVPAASAGDDAPTAKAIEDVIACLGGEKDRGGADGVSRAKLDAFFADAAKYVAWGAEPEKDAAIIPLGDATAAAYAAYDAVRAKIDDFFARTALAAMDPRAVVALNPSDADIAKLSATDLSPSSAALQLLPVAHIEASRALPLKNGLNPAFAAAIATFCEKCLVPLLGAKDELRPDDWNQIHAKLAAHRAWLGRKPVVVVEKLGLPRVKELAAGPARGAIEKLIGEDDALAPEAKVIDAVDKLVHYYVHLARFLDNFVAFRDFYQRKTPADFQVGTLYLDGRSFDLCLRVDDVAKHSTLAAQSMTCLAYCECTRDGGKEKLTIAAAVTNGDSDFLAIGRNGVFYDRKGRDWDATVIKIIDQPISIRQAFWRPYKSVARFVSTQIESFAGAQASAADESLAGAAAHAGTTATTAATAPAGAPAPAAAPAPPASFDVAKYAGIFAAVGLALGAIGTAIAAVVSGFMGLQMWQMPLAIAGAMLAVSGPAMLLAAMKLRQRNLGPLLDAAGWAINARAKINVPFGAALTKLAVLPPGSERALVDPYAEKKRPWALYIGLLLALSGGTYVLYETGLLAHWWSMAVERVNPSAAHPADVPPSDVEPSDPAPASAPVG